MWEFLKYIYTHTEKRVIYLQEMRRSVKDLEPAAIR